MDLIRDKTAQVMTTGGCGVVSGDNDRLLRRPLSPLNGEDVNFTGVNLYLTI
ncbi:hypothetical protein MTR_8g077930 [Medicago truncatula]|uniref:Uncharacterized protein n=1 Tax=Medicago truncatula TaxID=3880 RepID=G7LEV1_MEDTR|nr:hypothetical protein MTR_8g077930 [Medicago truncatula]